MTTQGSVVPFGYSTSGSQVALERLMGDDAAYLVDIRLSPRSGYKPEFNGSALEEQFPKRYVHIPELGNLNYRPEDRHKGIKIADPERGIPRLVNGVQQGFTLILLCACSNYQTCHRKVVIEMLQKALPNVEVVHHSPGDPDCVQSSPKEHRESRLDNNPAGRLAASRWICRRSRSLLSRAT